MDKSLAEKHKKYVDFYSTQGPDDEYWGLGIENESYLMFDALESVDKAFFLKLQEPERYSVNYWKNYRGVELQNTLKRLPSAVKVPTYVNSYLFRHADLLGEHATVKGSRTKENPMYSGQTIDEYVRRVSPAFSHFFEKNLIYDGDTFEFTTFNFYKTTVPEVIKELLTIKKMILKELNTRLVSKFTIFKGPMIFPKLNYGFAKFQTNLENVAICNNGTYHINLTLPTKLVKGEIASPEEFKARHANAIRAIQWIEPLLVGLYGTPDILHILNPSYAGGSQRLAMSRYIGLGTYDTLTMEKGKLLDTFAYKKYTKDNYFTKLHVKSPYNPPQTIGYDVNYNKFKKHGIELRIFDYFPEEYLESVMNLLVLVCEKSTQVEIPDPKDNASWVHLCMQAVKQGSCAGVKNEFYTELYRVFSIPEDTWIFYRYLKMKAPMLYVANRLASHLYKSRGDVSNKLSPDMKPVVMVDYNSKVKREFRGLLSCW
jgi:hypothetical protein